MTTFVMKHRSPSSWQAIMKFLTRGKLIRTRRFHLSYDGRHSEFYGIPKGIRKKTRSRGINQAHTNAQLDGRVVMLMVVRGLATSVLRVLMTPLHP